MARECGGCHYKLRFCVCVNHRTAPGSELKDQTHPLTSDRARRLAPSSLTKSEHRKRCAAQGWKAR